MSDATTVTVIQDLIRRESLSLLTYIGDAFPWTTQSRGLALVRLRQIGTAHNQAVADLRGLLTSRRIAIRTFGSFPSGFTALNFLSLDHILKRLIAAERQSLTLLEADVVKLSASDLHSAVEKFLTLKRDLLAQLETLAHDSSEPLTTAAS